MKNIIKNSNNYGKLAILIGTLILVPLVTLPFYSEDIKYTASFLIPGGISLILGFTICIFSKHKNDVVGWHKSVQSGSFTVLFAWGYGFVMGALPFVLSGQLTFLRALFEAVSGWTTTGLSVMDVSITPKIFLFHRGFMQFCGGLGFIMMMVMLVQEKESMNLYSAEGHPDKLMPNLKKTARIIFLMYVSFLVIGTILYIMFGMEPFDSILHAMCSLSTGGFSTKLNSIGEYNSFPIEIITIILMLIGTTNFAVLLLVAKRNWKQFFKVSEIRFMIGLLLIATPLIAMSLKSDLGVTTEKGFQMALFDGVSALSTTGYSSMSYTTWPPFAIGMLIVLMIIGGGIGSTAGGMKMSRVYLMCRITLENIRKRLWPARWVSAPQYVRAQGKTFIDEATINDTSGFVFCYIMIFVTGSLMLTLTADCTITEAMFEFSSALGTVGLSIGVTSATATNGTLIIEIIGMILGRLEIFIVITGIYSFTSLIKKRFTKKSEIIKTKLRFLKD